MLLILISISIVDEAIAWEDTNNDGIIIKMCPPPGREWVYDWRIGWHEIVTGYPLEDMMNDPDDWDVTRSTIDYFGYTSWILNDKFSDSLLTGYFTQINTWDMNFDLGVIAIKDLPGATTGEQCYAIEQGRITRFDSLGAEFASLTIDEPYTATKRGSLGSSVFPPISNLDYAVRETADWFELVRADSIMGELDICLIESYPQYNDVEDLIEFIEELDDECVGRSIDGIDAFAVDYNWAGYSDSSYWEGLIQIEEYCDSISLPFSMIIWPANSYSRFHYDEDFCIDVMDLGDEYFNTYGGEPDILDFTAWDYVPRQMTPESYENAQPIDAFPFTWVFLRFYDQYISTDGGAATALSTNLQITSAIPNPSRGSISVGFDCSNTVDHTVLKVFDVSGRIVRAELIGSSIAGENTYFWDGCSSSGAPVSEGVYFIQIRADGMEPIMKKVLIVN